MFRFIVQYRTEEGVWISFSRFASKDHAKQECRRIRMDGYRARVIIEEAIDPEEDR